MISTIDDMIGYFAVCLSNAASGSTAEKEFDRYIFVLAEIRQMIKEQKEDDRK